MHGMYAWSVRTGHAPSRHFGYTKRIYGHTTTAMHNIEHTSHPPRFGADRNSHRSLPCDTPHSVGASQDVLNLSRAAGVGYNGASTGGYFGDVAIFRVAPVHVPNKLTQLCVPPFPYICIASIFPFQPPVLPAFIACWSSWFFKNA